jgi:RNA polymerase sigma-70 factor (ECF subfamily)
VRLFARNVEAVQSYIGTLLPQAADADEVFQQTSITLWRKFDEFRNDGNFAAWACGIAFNLVRNFRRVESRRPVFLLSDDVLETLGQARLEKASSLPDRREALKDCLEKLSAEDRELLDRCYAGSANVAAIATDLGRTANSLYKRLKTVRGLLFDCITRAVSAEGAHP